MGTGRDIILEMLSGYGNLDARALWAGIVGRYRLTHGDKVAFVVRQDRPLQVANNVAKHGVYKFVGISLPVGAPVNPLSVLFTQDEKVGANTAIPVRLTDAMGNQDAGAPAVGGGAFYAILQPGEQLFAQLPTGAVTTANLVITRVSF